MIQHDSGVALAAAAYQGGFGQGQFEKYKFEREIASREWQARLSYGAQIYGIDAANLRHAQSIASQERMHADDVAFRYANLGFQREEGRANRAHQASMQSASLGAQAARQSQQIAASREESQAARSFSAEQAGLSRDFRREEISAQQTFAEAQQARDYSYRSSEAEKSRNFQAEQNALQQTAAMERMKGEYNLRTDYEVNLMQQRLKLQQQEEQRQYNEQLKRVEDFRDAGGVSEGQYNYARQQAIMGFKPSDSTMQSLGDPVADGRVRRLPDGSYMSTDPSVRIQAGPKKQFTGSELWQQNLVEGGQVYIDANGQPHSVEKLKGGDKGFDGFLDWQKANDPAGTKYGDTEGAVRAYNSMRKSYRTQQELEAQGIPVPPPEAQKSGEFRYPQPNQDANGYLNSLLNLKPGQFYWSLPSQSWKTFRPNK